MKKYIFILLVACTLCAQANDIPMPANAAFIANKGQWDSNVKYLMKANNFNAWIVDSGLIYDYFQFYNDSLGNTLLKNNVIFMKIINANRNVHYVNMGKKDEWHNYFIGNDSSRWATQVPLYSEVTAENVYDGINIRYYSNLDSNASTQIRYDFELMPNANPNNIKFSINGAKSINISKNGELEIETHLGIIKHRSLLAFQYINKYSSITGIENSDIRGVDCQFIKYDNNTIGFEVGNYDKNKPLIIDPLIYSALLGSTGKEFGYCVAVDSGGNAYAAGETYSINFPTAGAIYDPSFNDYYKTSESMTDAFLSKIDSTGKKLIFSTFLGGTGRERIKHIVLDEARNIVVVGESESMSNESPQTQFPTKSSNAALCNHNGGWDLFATKFANTGASLMFSILLGGDGYETAGGLAISQENDIWVAGATTLMQKPFPTTIGAYSSTYAGGSSDGFVSRIDKDGSMLLYSTLLGGDANDTITAIAVDILKKIHISGVTSSTNFPTNLNAYQRSLRGGSDIFVAKFDSSLSTLEYSTYIGGTRNDYAAGIALADGKYPVISGYSLSTNFPTTPSSYSQKQSDSADIILFKFDTLAQRLIFSTTVSSNALNKSTGVAIDKLNHIHISGYTNATNYPTTWDAFFDTYSEFGDMVYSVFDSAASKLMYSSYIGGKAYDYAYGLALDNMNAAYIVGATTSGYYFPHSRVFTDSIYINGAWKSIGDYDVVVFKATEKPYPGELETNINLLGTEFCPGAPYTIEIYTPHAFYFPDNTFYVQLSDTNGNFDKPIVIGELHADTGGKVNIVFPRNLPVGYRYRIRVVSTRPRSIGEDNGKDLTLRGAYISVLGLNTQYVCANNQVTAYYATNSCFDNGNVFTLQLSDVTGSFASPIVIGKKTGIASDSITGVIPDSAITKSGDYSLRIVSSSPAATGDTMFIAVNLPKIEIGEISTFAFCASAVFGLPYESNSCYQDGNTFYALLSDATGSFDGKVDTIGAEKTNRSGVIFCTIPSDVQNGTHYKMRIASTMPPSYAETAADINFIIGTAYVYTNNIKGKEFCKGFSFDVDIHANNCFNYDNKFIIYMLIDDKWVEIGETQMGDTVAKITIPDADIIKTGANKFKIMATSPEISSEEFDVVITSPNMQIKLKEPTHAYCTGAEAILTYKSNACFVDNTILYVQLSDKAGSFDNAITLDSAKYAADTAILFNIPSNIAASTFYKLRIMTNSSYITNAVSINIIQVEASINADISDMSVMCDGISFYVDYTANSCFNDDNIFIIQLSDANGNFNLETPIIIGDTLSSTSGRIYVEIPIDLVDGNKYKFMISSTSPVTQAIFEQDFTITKPYIMIDELTNFNICAEQNPGFNKQPNILALTAEVIVPFEASDCYSETSEFILQIAPNGDFNNAINLDSCQGNMREFKFILPSNIEMGTPYSMRVISNFPADTSNISSVDVTIGYPQVSFDGMVKTMICKGNLTTFKYISSYCFNVDNVFYLELSDINGSFISPYTLAFSDTIGAGTFYAELPPSLPAGDGYRMRIKSTSPIVTYYNNALHFTIGNPEILTGNIDRLRLSRNDTISVPFNTNCLDPTNIDFFVELSDSRGSFDAPVEIGEKTGWQPNGLILTRIPSSVPDGSKYRVRVVSKIPELIGNSNEKDIMIRGTMSIEDENEGIRVYPNPFESIINIANLNEQKFINIEISDIMGRLLYVTPADVVANSYRINVEDFPAGVYFISIHCNAATVYRYRLMKIN